MPFDLPDLDAVDAPQLYAELRARIPHYTPRWTDYNDSDPGITLLQMLTWLTETLAYQANRVPLEAYRNMLRWILGVAATSNSLGTHPLPYADAAIKQHDQAFCDLQGVLAQIEQGVAFDLDALQQAVLTFRRSPYQALTVADVETLALESNVTIAASPSPTPSPTPSPSPSPTPSPKYVKRAYAYGSADLAQLFILSDADAVAPSPQSITSPLVPPGTVRLLYQYTDQTKAEEKAEETLVESVRQYLIPRTLLGNQISTKSAVLTPVNVSCTVHCLPRECVDSVAQAVATTIANHLQPVRDDGGADWLYNVAPDQFSLMPVVSAVPGVDATTDPKIEIGFGAPPLVLSGKLAQLGVTTVLGEFPGATSPPGEPGLPRLGYLEVVAMEASS